MIPLDNYEKWTPRLDDAARTFLSAPEMDAYQAISPKERLAQLKSILEQPIATFTVVNEVYFRARWAEALNQVHFPQGGCLLEIASGAADMIPQSMARTHAGSRYVAANMNKQLTAGLLRNTAGLPVSVRVIEDDAAAITRHLPPESVDAIAFQHGVNDVVQAILCDREGIDTIYTDWMAVLPRMITILQSEIRAGTFTGHASVPFLALLASLSDVLKKGGTVMMNHYMFQLDLDWGYPPDLFENFMPIVRGWLKDLPGFAEVRLDGFDPQWWIFLQRR